MSNNVFEKYVDKETFDKLVEIDTIPNFLNKIRNDYSSLLAVGQDDYTITYESLFNDTLKVASKLKINGIKRRANVGLLCNNNYDFVKTSLGIMAYGAVATLLPFQLDEKSIYGCTLKYNLTCFFYENALEDKIQFAKENLKNVVFINIDKVKEIELNDELFDFNIDTNEAACIVLTGGTTGKSKGAILSHRALLKGTLNGTYGVKDVFNQVYYSLMPLTHVFGFIRNLMTSLYTGSIIYFCSDKRQMFKQMQTVKPTILIVVPALAELFLNITKQFGLGMLGGNIKTIICGGASVPPYLVTEFHKLNINFCPGYGLTELANLVSGNPEGNRKPDSVGMLFPDQEIKVVNDELWIKGKNLMNGYYNEPVENELAFTDGWFKTGDLVRFDDEGYMYIIGRIKDIIVLPNGENVSPAYIESKINELEFIQDSLVYEKVNEFGVNELVLEVLLRPAVINKIKEEKNLSNVKDFVYEEVEKVNETLFTFERVSKIIIREEDFPRSPSMKIIRPKRG